MTKKEYLDIVVEGCSRKKYIKDMPMNYVILEEGATPVCFDNYLPVVYGSIEECKDDMVDGDIMITEKEFYDKFLTD